MPDTQNQIRADDPALTSRRALVAAGALAAAGTALLGTSDEALATHNPSDELDFDGFVNVTKGTTPAPHNNDGNATPGILAAINAAHNLSGDGIATVYFPPGTYRCDSQVAIPANTRLVGHGRLSVLRAGAGNIGHLLAATGSDAISIEDLTLDGRTVDPNSWSSAHTGSLIRIAGVSTGLPAKDITLRKLHVLGTQASSYAALLLVNVRQGVVHDCVLEDCSGSGIALQQLCTDCIVQGNLLQGCKGDNIGLHPIVGGPVPARIVISHNVCDTGGVTMPTTATATGVAVRGGKNVAIVGNSFRGGRLGSVELVTNNGDVEDVEVSANVLTESGKVASSSQHATAGSGVMLTAFGPNRAIRRVSIKDNAIRDPRYHGISVFATNDTGIAITDVSISANVIVMGGTDNIAGTSGIKCTPSGPVENLLITNNEIRASRSPSIDVRNASVKRLDVSGNQMADTPSGSAIQITAVAEVAVTGNRAVGGHNPGLKLDAVTGDVVVARNNLTESSVTSGFKPVDIVSVGGVRRLRIRDNPGFNPWTGERSIDGSGSDRNLRVPGPTGSLPVAFPTSGGVPKVKIFATPMGDLQAYVSAHSVQSDNFTLRVILPGSVPSGSKISWIAEPFDP